MKKIKHMCTAFRDGLQSAFGARVLTADFLPALEAAREAGLTYFEAGGGDRFHSLFLDCHEDAFAMMDAFRVKAGPGARLQTLARGIHIVGLDSQPRDIVTLHAALFAKHGIDAIRNYDPLNDVDNLLFTGRAITAAGLEHQVTITLMDPPTGKAGVETRAHTADYYEAVLRRIVAAEVPFTSVCFKDASGTSAPAKVFDTIGRARRILPSEVAVQFHTHETAGMSVSAYRAALEAGADTIDLSLAPCSGGTCQPDLLVMWHALRGTDFDLDIDVDRVRHAEEVFRECLKDYALPAVVTRVEPRALWSPLSANVLAATVWMLREKGVAEKLPDLIAAMNEVVRRGGLATSVAPVSEFYAKQATNNVLSGPWRDIDERFGRMVLGYYGKTPVPPDPEIVALASEQLGLAPTSRPALDLNDEDASKGVAAATKRLRAAGVAVTDETVFVAATCKDRGVEFLAGRGGRRLDKLTEQRDEPTTRPRAAGPVAYCLKVNERAYEVLIDGDVATVDGKDFVVDLKPGAPRAFAAPSAEDLAPTMDELAAPFAGVPHHVAAADATAVGVRIAAEMPGRVLKLLVGVGDTVTTGQSLLSFEAMKMEMTVTAPRGGRVKRLAVPAGQQFAAGDLLAEIG